MNYQAMGQIKSADWCSPANPQAGCTTLAGVCKPMNHVTLGKFKELQNQLNRLAVANNLPKINVDGRIGSKTVSLYNKGVGGSMTSCDQLSAITVTGQSISLAKAAALAIGAPAKVDPPITSRPSIAKADGTVADPPLLSVTDSIFGLFESPIGLLAVAGLGYMGYRTMSKKPKRRRKTRRRTTRRRRRRS